jgi:hypothetical protein
LPYLKGWITFVKRDMGPEGFSGPVLLGYDLSLCATACWLDALPVIPYQTVLESELKQIKATSRWRVSLTGCAFQCLPELTAVSCTCLILLLTCRSPRGTFRRQDLGLLTSRIQRILYLSTNFLSHQLSQPQLFNTIAGVYSIYLCPPKLVSLLRLQQ